MKTIISIFATIAIFANVLTANAQNENTQVPTNKVTVIIEGVKGTEGNIMIAIGDYKTAPQKMIGKMIKPQNGTITVEFDKVPYGNHYIYMFHDENNNHNLDLDEQGKPAEGYGIQKGADPSKYETSITVGPKPLKIEISAYYPTTK